MTFEQLTEILDRIDDECLARHGQTLALAICGTKHFLAVSFECVLWDSEDEPTDDPEELKRHMEMADGINTAVATLEKNDHGRNDE